MNCSIYTLGEVTDNYEIRKGNRARKYYKEHLIIAQDVWKELFQNTIYVVKRVWLPIRGGGAFNHIDIPEDNVRILGINVLDKCDKLHPLYYDATWNTIAKPAQSSSCGCKECNCNSGLCGEVNNFTVTTKEIIIAGKSFQEKTYMKYCRNGDIIEYTDTWVKKYKGQNVAGDYNNDYNNDYNVAVPFENYEIIPWQTKRTVCKLETKSCGCPKDSIENNRVVMENCGCCVGAFNREQRCQALSQSVSQNKYGEFNFSECGTMIYLKPYHHCDGRPEFKQDFVLITYQTNGVHIGEEIQVPEYAREAMFAGIDYRIKQYNDKYLPNAKILAKNNYELEKNNIIRFLNPLNLTALGKVQDSIIKW